MERIRGLVTRGLDIQRAVLARMAGAWGDGKELATEHAKYVADLRRDPRATLTQTDPERVRADMARVLATWKQPPEMS